jgi:hypothetical protein
MNVRILKKLIRNLQAKITCPGCGSKFTKPEQVQFRGYVDNTYFLQLNCLKCPTLVFATVMVTKEKDLIETDEVDGIQPIEKVQELSKNDKKSEKKLKKISTDDVIDAHKLLEDFDGNFKEMFGE